MSTETEKPTWWDSEWEDPRWAYGYGYQAIRRRGKLKDGFAAFRDDEDLSDCFEGGTQRKQREEHPE